MARRRLLASLFFLALLLGAAAIWRLFHPPAAGPLRLAQVSFSDLPGWSMSDPRAALAALRRSCAALSAKPDKIPVGSYAGTARDWRAPCAAAAKTTEARAFFEHWFQPFQVSAGAVKDGLFTGYYEPQLHASHTKHDRFQTPVYGLPSDLVGADLGLFRDSLAGEHIFGRVEGHRLVPYATRAEIDARGSATAPTLFYADDAIAVFFLHIQGSGRVEFDDGSVARAAYAGANGQRYTAIGRTLIAQGALAKDQVSLQTIRAWLTAHPDKARAVMESDASFVFFKETPVGDANLGSVGSGNVALTPGASIAVDQRIHPLGVPFYIATDLPRTGEKLNRLTVAQDTGGAIRGPVRADIFFGFGARAESLAGEMKQTGRMFVLLPKSVAARVAR